MSKDPMVSNALVSKITNVVFKKKIFFDTDTILNLHDDLYDAVCVTHLPI